MMIYICTKFHKKYHRLFKSYRADTIFIPIISKGHNSIFIPKIQRGVNPKKSVGGVTVYVLCTSSVGGLYLYQVS